jgi:uncharacterized protein with FMN-binding domain
LEGTGIEAGSEATLKAPPKISGIEYTLKQGESNGCGKADGTYTDGTYEGMTTLKGFDADEDPDGIYVLGEGAVGAYLAGEASGEEAKKPRFEAEAYPMKLEGERDPGQVYAFKTNFSVKCTSAIFDANLTSSTTAFQLEAEYGGCKAASVFPAAVSMNSCHYVLHVLNAGPPYVGSMDVACTEGGDAIEVRFYSTGQPVLRCTVTIPPQEGLEGTGFENVGAGKERGFVVASKATGIKYTLKQAVSSGCGNADGTYTDGTYEGSATIHGFK